MKICIIASHRENHAPQRIFSEGKKRGHEMHLTTWEELSLQVEQTGISFQDTHMSLDCFDAIIPRSNRYAVTLQGGKIRRSLDTMFRLLIEYAREKNIFFLNQKYYQSYQSLDKLTQQFFFFQNNLPGISSCYFSDPRHIQSSRLISFPLIAKLTRGSTGRSVYKLNSMEELNAFIYEKNQAGEFFLLQKYHPISCDYRVIVVGNKVLGIMKRSPNGNEWRTNFSLGGKVAPLKKNPEMEKLALAAARQMKLDLAGIDILQDKEQLHIIETNSLPQFKGFESVFPQVNVAGEIIKLAERKFSRKH